MSARKVKSVVYSVHPSVEYAQAVLRNLPDKTGYSIIDWIEKLENSSRNTVKERKQWLKDEFGVGGTTANIIANFSLGEAEEMTDPEAYLQMAPKYVAKMYSGEKEPLRPIYDEIVDRILTFGPDIRICPVKTIVSVYRNNVIAQIKPTTKKRVDLGLCLKNYHRTIPEWIINTGGTQKGDRITHRIALNSVDEINDKVIHWLKIAYDLDK
ncbi:MAG TPA: DUF5655 domain-containing protein [Balneolales bacterium]|nr:DUF5655 domain-containing protein [Balneolales bacterium]